MQNPGFAGATRQKMWKNVENFVPERPCEKPRFLGEMGSEVWKNVGNFASEEENPGKTWEILHQKRTRPVQNPGFAGATRQKMWKNVGNFVPKKDKALRKTQVSWRNGVRSVEKCREFCIGRGQIVCKTQDVLVQEGQKCGKTWAFCVRREQIL